MVNAGSPPSSWYDPPMPRFEIEIKRERKNFGGRCERPNCWEDIYMDVEIGDVRWQNGYIVSVCKNHYETIYEDTLEELEENEPDWDEED